MFVQGGFWHLAVPCCEEELLVLELNWFSSTAVILLWLGLSKRSCAPISWQTLRGCPRHDFHDVFSHLCIQLMPLPWQASCSHWQILSLLALEKWGSESNFIVEMKSSNFHLTVPHHNKQQEVSVAKGAVGKRLWVWMKTACLSSGWHLSSSPSLELTRAESTLAKDMWPSCQSSQGERYSRGCLLPFLEFK